MGEQRQFSASGSATGIGDILIRLKKAATSLGPTDLALALDVRLPTGQEENLLGSGALGLKPTFMGHPANGEVGGALAIEIRSNPVYFCSGILLKDIYQ